MGETKAIKPLVENYKDIANISVITNTGFERQNKLQKCKIFTF